MGKSLAAPPTSAHPTQRAPSSPPRWGTAMNVLIIDDDRGTAGALAQALRTGGFTDTRVGCSPDEARDCIRQGVRPDVVFLDVDHPHIDAFALAKELCAALPRRPLL